jgi:hypothetical protein
MQRPETKIETEMQICACFITIFIAYFPVTSVLQSLISGICIAVIILTWLLQ